MSERERESTRRGRKMNKRDIYLRDRSSNPSPRYRKCYISRGFKDFEPRDLVEGGGGNPVG